MTIALNVTDLEAIGSESDGVDTNVAVVDHWMVTGETVGVMDREVVGDTVVVGDGVGDSVGVRDIDGERVLEQHVRDRVTVGAMVPPDGDAVRERVMDVDAV